MFITLTEIILTQEKVRVRINTKHIVSYRPYLAGCMVATMKGSHYVTEKLEQIDDLMIRADFEVATEGDA